MNNTLCLSASGVSICTLRTINYTATESSKFNCNIKVDSLLLEKASLRMSSSLTE